MAVIFTLIAIPLVVLVFVALGILINAWEAWWLYPFWAQIVVPLGLPQISFWMFFSLCIFVASIIQRIAYADHITTKTADKDTQTHATVSIYMQKIIGPVMVWLILKWALS